MRVARKHPALGWLCLEGNDYSRSMDKLLVERDKALLNDPNASGMPKSFIDFVWAEQMPELAKRPYYRNQIESHVVSLAATCNRIDREIKTIAKGSIEELEAAKDLKTKLEDLVKE